MMNVSQATMHTHSGKHLFDLHSAFNAPPKRSTVDPSFDHTTRLGIHLKSARVGSRPPVTDSPRRQSRSAPTRRQTSVASSTNQTDVKLAEGNVRTKSVTFVKEGTPAVPFYDEVNMHRSHTSASFYAGSTKIKQLPLHPETDGLSHRFTYSCKSRIMPLPRKGSEKADMPLAPSPTRGLFISCTPQKPRSGSARLKEAQKRREEQLSAQRVHLIRTLSDLQSHRVDRRYYVSGQSMAMEPRYSVSEKEIQELLKAKEQTDIVSKRNGVAGRPPIGPSGVRRSSILKKKDSNAATSAPQDTSHSDDAAVSVTVSVKGVPTSNQDQSQGEALHSNQVRQEDQERN